MGRAQDFFLNEAGRGAITAEVNIAPFQFPFTIKTITAGENAEIRRSCQKISFDKKTRQRQTETDQDLYNNRLIVACTVDPNFKDAALQAKYGVLGAEALVNACLNFGQHTNLLLAIMDTNNLDDDINELVEEAKNSSPAEETMPTPTENQTTPTMPYSD